VAVARLPDEPSPPVRRRRKVALSIVEPTTRRRTLRVIAASVVFARFAELPLVRYWTPRDGLPGPTRASCPPPSAPCPYVLCRHHLARVAGFESAGRRVEGRPPMSKLRPIWLDATAPTCALHEAERSDGVGSDIATTSAALGLRPSRVHAIQASALAKLKAAGANVRELAEPERPSPSSWGERGTFCGEPDRMIGGG
jgi:hypothetical protein